MDKLKKKIFDEIRDQGIANGYVWRFQQYNSFKFSKLNPIEQKNFSTAMENLCADGIFTVEGGGSVPMYRLTEKGEKEIWEKGESHSTQVF